MSPDTTMSLSELEAELEAVGFGALNRCHNVRTEEEMSQLLGLPRGADAETIERARANATPREEVTQKLWACIIDVVAFGPAVRHLHEVAQQGQPRLTAAVAKVRANGTTEDTTREFNEARRPAEAFVVSLKAMYVLVRALQDSAYVVLFELLLGSRCGKGPKASMKQVVLKTANPVRLVLDKHWPSYVPWFDRHRSLRNAFKEGLLTGWSHVPAVGGDKFAMRRIGVSLDTVKEDLRQCISLMGIIVEEAGRVHEERRQRRSPPSSST